SLLVFGTEAGTKELERVVGLLDKPLRQVEVEGQFVQISAEDVKTLPIDFGTEQSPASVGVVRGNFQAQLSQLVAQKKAKVIMAPRVTTINNLTASLGTSTSRPAVIGVKGEDGAFRPLFDSTSQNKNSRLLLGTSFQFTVTPTINADDTVTLFVTPSQTLQLINSQNKDEPLWSQQLNGARIIANVRDTDTLAVTGLTSRLFSELEIDPKAPVYNVVLFVTPRIIRRAGVDDVKPVALQR
ncbi:MAG: hypothetical protein KY445_12010, partial [Armatimonadetes bacterium]|nr:hypothetical protein [Armatimonadota bacterium]